MTSPHSHSRRTGFTLVEVLVAIVIIGVLAALLLPVIAGAVKTARNAQVSAEEQMLAQALASFKTQYGDYPPSRILLAEDGNYPTSSTTSLAGSSPMSASGMTDITLGQLASRSVQYLRKFFPRASFSTTGSIYPDSNKNWHDFDGDGSLFSDSSGKHFYILDGRQCLVFFLGGIPQSLGSGNSQTIAMTGFSKSPTFPFYGPTVTGANNRSAPFFEFDAGRLAVPPAGTAFPSANLPGYLDKLGARDSSGANPIGYFAYFSAYGNNAYDPNDVNLSEPDSNGTSPVLGYFNVAFPVVDSSGSISTGPNTGPGSFAKSPDPNPYSATLGVNQSNGAVNWINPNSFQIISPGADGIYGPGGQYLSANAAELLPFDSSNSPYSTSDQTIRQFERDNIASFHNGKLE